MKTHLLSVAVFAGLVWGLSGATAAPWSPASAAPRIGYDFVYLGDPRPILLRFHVDVDGQPLEGIWRRFIDQNFDYLDVDGNGVLSQREAAGIPPVEMLYNNAVIGRPIPAGGLPFMDLGRDVKITREDLAVFYRRRGAPPFQFRMGEPPVPAQLVLKAYGAQPSTPSADALNERLLNLLDANKDGKLSRAELAAAPAFLMKLDADDDETISTQELNGTPTETAATGAVVVKSLFNDYFRNGRGQ
jgi:Ca2+-binding EF-hand superfamily protein